jgi:hypothetical protein
LSPLPDGACLGNELLDFGEPALEQGQGRSADTGEPFLRRLVQFVGQFRHRVEVHARG